MFNQYLFNEALFNEGTGAVVTSSAQQNLLYIFDSSEALTAIIPASDYTDAKHYEKLNGENRFSFKVVNDDYMVYLTVGSLVAFIDLDSYWQFFEIKQVTDTHKATFEKQVFCQHCLYELIDDIVTDVRPSSTALAALTSVLSGTRWNVGIVDDLGMSSCTVYYESVLAGVHKVAEAWGGELRWRCMISGGVITRYCDLLIQRGADTGKIFSYDKDISEIEREIDLTDVCTAMYGRGKGIETDTGGYGRRLTFKDEAWTIAGGNPANKPAGQEYVGDPAALALYGRPGGRHRFGIYTNEDQTDAAALLQETWDYLQTVNTPRATYKLKVIVLEMLTGYSHEAVRVGDTVRAIDRVFVPELLMSARVVELERDILDPKESSVTLGNFAPTIVETTFNVQKEVTGIKNKTYNTNWLDGKISVLQNEIENTQSYVFQTPGDGILIMDAATFAEATKAMKLGGGIFAIANTKTGDQWNWRTFGTGAGFTADEITTGLLSAALVQIGADTTFEDGYNPSEKFNAPGYVTSTSEGIKVFDASNNLRVILGSWLVDAVRKYGLKIWNGEIYSSFFRAGGENETGSYIELGKHSTGAKYGYMHFTDSQSRKILAIEAGGDQGSIIFYDNGISKGRMLINGSSTKELTFWTEDTNGIYLTASTGESIALGPTGGVSSNRGVAISRIRGNLLPYTNYGGSLGSSSYKWQWVYCYDVIKGDDSFTEKTCAICGEPFREGEVLGLLVKKIDEYTHTIPVHVGCQGKSATITLPHPVFEPKYELQTDGNVKVVMEPAFEEFEEEVMVLHPDFEFDESTGSFKRSVTPYNIDLFGVEALEKGVKASKRNALAIDTVTRRVPKMQDIEVVIGQEAGG